MLPTSVFFRFVVTVLTAVNSTSNKGKGFIAKFSNNPQAKYRDSTPNQKLNDVWQLLVNVKNTFEEIYHAKLLSFLVVFWSLAPQFNGSQE